MSGNEKIVTEEMGEKAEKAADPQGRMQEQGQHPEHADLKAGLEQSHTHAANEKGDSLSSPPPEHKVLTIRSHSGLSGDMLFSGLAVLNLLSRDYAPDSEEGRLWLSELCVKIMPQLADCAALLRTERFGIYGWSLDLHLPIAHEHRNLNDIRKIAKESKLAEDARTLGLTAFELLAHCEAEAHNRTVEEVHFHELGALDSILDIFGVCELYCRLGQPEIISSPLPMADGIVSCAHGILPAPAPATLKLLHGVPIRPYEGALDSGEMLTPTALALLQALHVSYGSWPAFTVKETALVYGQRSFAGGPNGVIFAMGEASDKTF